MGIKERKQREKNYRRQQIKEAAKELFMLKGFKYTTMEDIANKAELSAGTIYQYFDDKDHLHASLALESIRPLVEKITKVHENKRLSIQNKILGFKDAMYEAYESDPLVFRNILQLQLINDFSILNTDLLNQTNGLFRKLLRIFADVYEQGVRQGIFRNGHGLVHADIIFGVFMGLMLWEEAKSRTDPKKNFFRSTLDKAFEIFINGVKRG